jgi:hypothetical protein
MMNMEGRAIAASRHRATHERSQQVVSAVPVGVDYRAWPHGIFSLPSEGHTAASALATSLAFLRMAATDMERRGENASALREHIASVEHLT